ncbi:CMGC SRPK kinase protein [Rutstroemia sp. NJR-2017a BVV2]|nr:CMGC SRPK kinase protein [Rutstroemia sp. NJR-2017a BVV2]
MVYRPSALDDVEESENYPPEGFHPLDIGDEMEDKYKVVPKLECGCISTVWLAQANLPCRRLYRLKITAKLQRAGSTAGSLGKTVLSLSWTTSRLKSIMDGTSVSSELSHALPVLFSTHTSHSPPLNPHDVYLTTTYSAPEIIYDSEMSIRSGERDRMGRQKVHASGQLPEPWWTVDGVRRPRLVIGEPEQTWDGIVRGRKCGPGGMIAEDDPWRNCAVMLELNGARVSGLRRSFTDGGSLRRILR